MQMKNKRANKAFVEILIWSTLNDVNAEWTLNWIWKLLHLVFTVAVLIFLSVCKIVFTQEASWDSNKGGTKKNPKRVFWLIFFRSFVTSGSSIRHFHPKFVYISRRVYLKLWVEMWNIKMEDGGVASTTQLLISVQDKREASFFLFSVVFTVCWLHFCGNKE